MKKYKLTDEVNERGLHRIIALRDIPRHNVKKGDLGGFIESEENLSQDGDAWIEDDTEVFNNARVSENALIYGDANVFGYAQVYGDACVGDSACIYGDVRVSGDAWVFDNAHIYDTALVCENAHIYGNAQIYGNVCIYGNACISGDAKVSSGKDYIVFKNWWSSERYFTWTRSNNMWKVGCFYGTGEELIAKAEKDSELSGKEYKRIVNYVESILKDEKSIYQKIKRFMNIFKEKSYKSK